MRSDTITDAREYLQRVPMWAQEKNHLSQVRCILDRMGDPDRNMHIIHVAGTNGKGSVCANLTGILTEAGYRVGTFTSPHLQDVRERLMIDGKIIREELFQETFVQVHEAVTQLVGEGFCHPVYFEYLFYMAMNLFAREKLDYVVLETGLGGRYDPTNAIRKPEAVVITSISFDHTQYLGETLDRIAGEKAGIIKLGIPVIYEYGKPESNAVIEAAAKECHAKTYPVFMTEDRDFIGFFAPYQAQNAALAIKTLEVLLVSGVSGDVCQRGLLKVSWPGRMEQVLEDVWLDGAHNPGGIQAFAEAALLLQSRNSKNIHLLFAAVQDKAYNDMVQLLCRQLRPVRVTVTRLKNNRSLGQEALAGTFRTYGSEICETVEAYGDVSEAFVAALQHKTAGDRLLIVGSLYLVGEIKEALRRNDHAGL